MKRFFIALWSVCVMLLSFSLTACGSTKAKIHGIHTCVGLPENGKTFSNILQYGQTYHLLVTYTAGGGSQYPVLSADNVKLYYDDNVLEIKQPVESIDDVICYQFTCKESITCTAVIIEVDGEYTTSVIISAK